VTSAPRRPGASVRVKLALSYAAIVVVAGVAMFAMGFLLLRYVPPGNLTIPRGYVPNRTDLMNVYVKYVWWALTLLTILGVAGGWLLAGRMLRPLDRITEAARRVRDGDLGHRIALPGRRDELTELADAFDDMVARVQHTVDEQRRFAANASHELRTPLAVIRTMLEVAQAAPEQQDMDALLHRIDEMNERSITLTEALLTLANVEQRPLELRPVDLADIAADAIDTVRTDGTRIRIDTELTPATTTGDAALLTQLAVNLLGNAIVHNDPGGGFVRVMTGPTPEGAELIVLNSGAHLDPAAVATYTEPFVRGAGRTRSTSGGVGLGLAIVASIVRAHGGRLELAARDEGGLRVRVVIPTARVRPS
jgi:two-component system, OmpR family, sensor histidine kinase VanS